VHDGERARLPQGNAWRQRGVEREEAIEVDGAITVPAPGRLQRDRGAG
jgi:hypothetical protein